MRGLLRVVVSSHVWRLLLPIGRFCRFDATRTCRRRGAFDFLRVAYFWRFAATVAERPAGGLLRFVVCATTGVCLHVASLAFLSVFRLELGYSSPLKIHGMEPQRPSVTHSVPRVSALPHPNVFAVSCAIKLPHPNVFTAYSSAPIRPCSRSLCDLAEFLEIFC